MLSFFVGLFGVVLGLVGFFSFFSFYEKSAFQVT